MSYKFLESSIAVLLLLAPVFHTTSEYCEPNKAGHAKTTSSKIPGMCIGIFVKAQAAESFEDCSAICQDIQECQWFTYYSNSFYCALHASCDRIENSCKDCMFGSIDRDGSSPASLGTTAIDTTTDQDTTTTVQETTTTVLDTMTTAQETTTTAQETAFKLMVIGGREALAANKAEVVDLSDANKVCPPMPNFPGAQHASVGTFIDGKVLVCGGSPHTNRCYFYNPVTASWDITDSLGTARAFAAAVHISPTEWWVSGGEVTTDNKLATSEVYTSNIGFTPYANLPEAKLTHNVIKANETHYMLLGDGIETKKAWMYDQTTGRWNPLPDLQDIRENAFAGLVTYPDGHQAVVVVQGNGRVSTEIFDLTVEAWSYGPVLPSWYTLEAGASVQLEDTFLIVGGVVNSIFSGAIYKFDPTVGPVGDWVELPQTLQFERYFLAAFLVPNDFVECL